VARLDRADAEKRGLDRPGLYPGFVTFTGASGPERMAT